MLRLALPPGRAQSASRPAKTSLSRAPPRRKCQHVRVPMMAASLSPTFTGSSHPGPVLQPTVQPMQVFRAMTSQPVRLRPHRSQSHHRLRRRHPPLRLGWKRLHRHRRCHRADGATQHARRGSKTRRCCGNTGARSIIDMHSRMRTSASMGSRTTTGIGIAAIATTVRCAAPLPFRWRPGTTSLERQGIKCRLNRRPGNPAVQAPLDGLLQRYPPLGTRRAMGAYAFVMPIRTQRMHVCVERVSKCACALVALTAGWSRPTCTSYLSPQPVIWPSVDPELRLSNEPTEHGTVWSASGGHDVEAAPGARLSDLLNGGSSVQGRRRLRHAIMSTVYTYGWVM